MLKKSLIIVVACILALFLLSALRPKIDAGMDIPALNALLRSLELAEGRYDLVQTDGWDFAVLNPDGQVLFASRPDLLRGPLAAAGNILLGTEQGSVIIVPRQDGEEKANGQYFLLAVCTVLGAGTLMLLHTFWLERRIIRPFRNTREAAEMIAAGRLDFPLAMDRGGIFGPFTESFDMMRSALRKAQAAQARAARDRQELVAKLSHDIRTPVASMQAVAELGALTAGSADRHRFEQIASKAVQLNVLVSNLLNASLGEETAFTFTTRPVSAEEISRLLEGADYRRWLRLTPLPACSVCADPVRLQQIFDNIFSNAYKYGAGPVRCAGFLQDGELLLEMEDAGHGVGMDEVAALCRRSFRGRNAEGAEGAGLGLYICDQLLQAMHGELLVRNGSRGLEVTVILPLSHGAAPGSARELP